jgi:hypothetical protein
VCAAQVVFRPLKLQHYSDELQVVVNSSSFVVPVHAYTPVTHIEVGSKWVVWSGPGGPSESFATAAAAHHAALALASKVPPSLDFGFTPTKETVTAQLPVRNGGDVRVRQGRARRRALCSGRSS